MSEPLVIMNMIKYNIRNKNNWYYGFDTKIFVKFFVISWICSWFRENYEDMHWSIQKEVRLLIISPHCIETYRRHPKGETVHWECSRIPDSVREFVIWFVISWKYSWFVCGSRRESDHLQRTESGILEHSQCTFSPLGCLRYVSVQCGDMVSSLASFWMLQRTSSEFSRNHENFMNWIWNIRVIAGVSI